MWIAKVKIYKPFQQDVAIASMYWSYWQANKLFIFQTNKSPWRNKDSFEKENWAKKSKKEKRKKKEKEKTNKEKNRLNLFYEYVLVDDSGIKTSDHIDEPEIWNIRAEIVFNMVIW